MEKIKIRVKSPEHSRKIQEHLFSLGYKWINSGREIDTNVLAKSYNLFTNTWDEGIITYSSNSSEEYFNSQPHTEVELIETISYEFREIPKRNVVKVGEFSYYEEELAEALKNIKPI